MTFETILIYAYLLAWACHVLVLYRQLRICAEINVPVARTEALVWPMISLILIPCAALGIAYSDSITYGLIAYGTYTSLYWSVSYIYNGSRAV